MTRTLSENVTLLDLIPAMERIKQEVASLLALAEPLERRHHAAVATIADDGRWDEAWEATGAEDGYSAWFDLVADVKQLLDRVEDVGQEEQNRRHTGGQR